jgi:hypothetical protein
MERIVRRAMVCVATAVLLSPFLTSGLAYADTAVAQSETAAKHCVLTLGERPPGSLYNDVASYNCFAADQYQPFLTSASVSFFTDANFRGNRLDIDPGGGCDSSGFGIRQMPSGWDNRVSSYFMVNPYSCDKSTAFDLANYGGYSQNYGSSVPWVGSRLNDKITSFRWWKG